MTLKIVTGPMAEDTTFFVDGVDITNMLSVTAMRFGIVAPQQPLTVQLTISDVVVEAECMPKDIHVHFDRAALNARRADDNETQVAVRKIKDLVAMKDTLLQENVALRAQLEAKNDT